MDLRRFALASGQEENNIEDIYEPLKHILGWMTRGVLDVPDIDVVYAEEMRLADNMKKDIIYIYSGCARPDQACHK